MPINLKNNRTQLQFNKNPFLLLSCYMCSYLFLFSLFWFYFAYCLLFTKWNLTLQDYIPPIFHTVILNCSCVWLILFFEFVYLYLNLISCHFLFSSCPIPFYIMLSTYKIQKGKIYCINILSWHICGVISWFDLKYVILLSYLLICYIYSLLMSY
jgi:hypothetical protein